MARNKYSETRLNPLLFSEDRILERMPIWIWKSCH